jgi:hypothetical protein
MEQINLSLMSDSEDKTVTKVNLNATFANREQATAFHAKVAALCEHAQRAGGIVNNSVGQIGKRLLGRP